MLVVCATTICLYRGCFRITCLDVREHHGGVSLLQLYLGPWAVPLLRCSGGKLRCVKTKSKKSAIHWKLGQFAVAYTHL